MINAVIRPDRAAMVVACLKKAGFPAATHLAGSNGKDALWLAVADPQVNQAVRAIYEGAYTGDIEDGSIFVTKVMDSFNIYGSREGN
jgi:nitrogen regulatory protein PII